MLSPFAHDDLIALTFTAYSSRLRRRSCDIFTVQIEMAVMTGAPYFAEIWPVLNDTAKMSAGRRKRF
jgi:hypothetical protein